MLTSNVSRRKFLRASALSGGGLIIHFSFLRGFMQDEPINDAEFNPTGYISIDKDGRIILLAPNPEIGQGVKTSLPVIIAEELCVNWQDIEVQYAPIAEKYGRQAAGGSGSVRGRFEELRKAGAAAREMLVKAAAQTWNVPVEECTAENGYVLHKDGQQKLAYGDLATKAAALDVPSSPQLKDPKDFRYIGTRIQDVDAQKIVTGQPLFGIDTRRDGMLYAMVARPPAYGKTLGSVDDAAALQVNGVKKVVTIKNAVAVLASSTWAAKKGRDALKIEWKVESPLENSSEQLAALRKMLDQPAKSPGRNDGDVVAALKNATQVLDVFYEMPTLSHGQMEPLNFFADVKDGKAELYGPTQVPGRAKTDVANALGIKEDAVSILTPRQGGGFGRKLMTDNVVEAALISAAAKTPVQVQWTREDDMQNDFYRPAEVHRMRAALTNNQLAGWYQAGAAIGRGVRGESYAAGALDNFRADSHGLESNTPTGWWRAPGANTMAFVAESFMDEVCTALKKDPVAFRLDLFRKAKEQPVGKTDYDPDKYISVVELVAKMSNWGTTDKGYYRGFATWYSFGSYAAHVLDLQMVNGQPRVSKVYCAINCGQVINRSGAENQVQGSIVDGISHAMYPKISFVDGVVQEKNFSQYRMLRINEAPLDIEVAFVDSPAPPTGLGEPGLPPVAPALANALFQATGKRIRKMPFIEQL